MRKAKAIHSELGLARGSVTATCVLEETPKQAQEQESGLEGRIRVCVDLGLPAWGRGGRPTGTGVSDVHGQGGGGKGASLAFSGWF